MAEGLGLMLSSFPSCIPTCTQTGRERQVVHFQVTVWSEDDVCSSPSTLVEAIHHIQAAQRKSGNKPIVVHGR